jgi:hypothetical protein
LRLPLVVTAVILCRAFVNEAQTKVSDSNFQFQEADSATTAVSLALTIGSDVGQYARILTHQAPAGDPSIVLPYGLQVTYDASGAMTGSASYEIIAMRVG